MAKPKRINVYREARAAADAFCRGDTEIVVAASTRPGSCRQVLPALIYKHLLEVTPKTADRYLKLIVDASVRD